MALRDKKFIRTKMTQVNEPLITVGGQSFSFNARFAKEAELKKYSKVAIFIDEKEYKIGFEFHSRENERNNFTLQFRSKKGAGAIIKAQEIIRNTPFIKKINSLKNSVDKRFPVSFDRFEKLYVINLSPAFETSIDDNKTVTSEARGIYRYLDGDLVVYIGRGNIKSRINSPERKEWKFDKIQYSIVEDQEKQAEWEAYWIRRHKEDHQGQLPFYNKIEGISS
jgi:hypothetical protein